MTKGQPKCVAFFILVYIALVISRLIHTPHSSEHFLITRTPADSDFLSPADVLKSLCMLKSLKEAYKAVMIRQRNRAIQDDCVSSCPQIQKLTSKLHIDCASKT
jgi:hypothetical protein